MTPDNTAENMLAVLNENTWTQRTTIRTTTDDHGQVTAKVCLVGAWMLITAQNEIRAINDSPFIQRLARVITEQYPEYAADYQYPSATIIAFNDAPGRTLSEVRAILEKTAAEEHHD